MASKKVPPSPPSAADSLKYKTRIKKAINGRRAGVRIRHISEEANLTVDAINNFRYKGHLGADNLLRLEQALRKLGMLS